MSAEDPSGYLPPHELRALMGSLVDRDRVPGPTPSSPGLAGAAASPAGIAPTLPDDPLALAHLVQGFEGASVAPVPTPDSVANLASLAASPGISPQLAPSGPSATVPTEPVAPQLVPASAPTAPAVSHGAPTAPTGAPVASHGAPSAPPASAASPDELTELGAMMRVPFASPSSVESPVAIPGAGMFSSAQGFGAPTSLAAFELPSFGVEHLSLLDDAAPSSAIASPDDRVSAVEPVAPDAPPYWLPAEPVQQPVRPSGGGAFDPYAVRRDFPILEERVHAGKRLVWLDNAATTQKPRAVIDRLTHYYEHENSNVHRAAHALAARATDAYEGARETTRRFLGASSTNEIVFVRGATEGINLIAKAWGRRFVERGDEIVLTHLEHHANIVPWQQLCADVGARLRIAPVDDRGDVILDEYEKLLCSRTKLVAFTQVSNALGTITPAREMIEIAHRWGATVVLDGAQAVSHMAVDVQALDCDFYVFSGHKVFAPTGIGAVYGKRAVLEAMPPWQGGGNMIRDVTFERTVYQDPPWRFEAGTGNIADAAGMGAALDYVMRIGMTTIDRYEHDLLVYATEQLQTVRGLTMIGTPRNKAGVLSFVLDGQRTEDVGAALDKDGIAVRSGHHCAQPILRRFGLEGTVRASLAFYNVPEDIDELVQALRRLQASA